MSLLAYFITSLTVTLAAIYIDRAATSGEHSNSRKFFVMCISLTISASILPTAVGNSWSEGLHSTLSLLLTRCSNVVSFPDFGVGMLVE